MSTDVLFIIFGHSLGFDSSGGLSPHDRKTLVLWRLFDCYS